MDFSFRPPRRTGGGGVDRGGFVVVPPDRPPRRVSPEPVAVLDVMAPTHGQVCLSGLERFFPAHTIHTNRATAVVDGDDCHLRQVDHYHVDRVELSLDQVAQTSAAQNALREMLAAPDDPDRIAAFQSALRAVDETPERRGPTEVSVPVRSSRLVTVAGSDTVVRAHRSRTTVNNRYVVNRTTLPAAEFLVRDVSLVQQFAYALLEPTPGKRTATFLRAVLRAGGRVDELALLNHASDLPRERTSLFGLFGAARIDDAATVMVGTGNTHEMDARIRRPAPTDRGILADLVALRRFAPPVVAPPHQVLPFTRTPAPGPRRAVPPELLPPNAWFDATAPKRPDPPKPPKPPKPGIDPPGRDGPSIELW